MGGFAIGITEFATMSLLPYFSRDLKIDAPTAGHVISSYALGVVVGAPVFAIIGAGFARRTEIAQEELEMMRQGVSGQRSVAHANGARGKTTDGNPVGALALEVDGFERVLPEVDPDDGTWCFRHK